MTPSKVTMTVKCPLRVSKAATSRPDELESIMTIYSYVTWAPILNPLIYIKVKSCYPG